MANEKKNKVLALIPTRLNSRRLPAKALLPINNIPIIISSIFENGNLLKICKSNDGIFTIVN